MVWNKILYFFCGSKGSAAVNSPADAVRATKEPSHPSIDDGHFSSSVLTHVAFQCANPSPLEDKNKCKASQESDAQSTSVDGASTRTNDKIKTKPLVEANASSTFEAAPKPVDEANQSASVADKKESKDLYIPTFDRVAPEWKWDILDGALEYMVLDVESDSIPKKGPAAEFMAMAKTEGFKVRNLPARYREFTNEEYEHALDVHKSAGIDVFPAHTKALHYYYNRWLFQRGVFDFPINSLTAEDVDRLRTIGFIKDAHVDFITGYAMLGHGALRRTLRHKQEPGPNGRKLLARRRWTVMRGSAPPTQAEIDKYILNAELTRFRTLECGKETPFLLLADRRPTISDTWISHHIEKYGTWGLKHLGYDDAEAVKTVEEPDESYVFPEYVAYDPVVAKEADIPLAPSQQHYVAQPSISTRGRSADTGPKGKSKKGERSLCPIPKFDLFSSRHTRSRSIVVDNEWSSESELEVISSPSAARAQRRMLKPKPKSKLVSFPFSDDEYSSEPDPALLSPRAVGPHPRPSKPRRKPVLKPASEDASKPDLAHLSPYAMGSRRRLSKPPPTPISMPSATELAPRSSDKPKSKKRVRDENEEEESLSEDSSSSTVKKVKGERAQNALISLPSDQPVRTPLKRERRMRLGRYGFFPKLDKHDTFRAHGACFPGADQDNIDMGPVVCPLLARAPSMDINMETIETREGMPASRNLVTILQASGAAPAA